MQTISFQESTRHQFVISFSFASDWIRGHLGSISHSIQSGQEEERMRET